MNEIFGGILEAFLRLVLEVVLKLPGYLIVRLINPQSSADPDGCLVVVCGIAFWVVVGFGVWGLVLLF